MKYSVVLIGLSVLVFSAVADDAYREFTSAQGQSIRGRVLSFDAQKQMVRIERDNKAKATIPLAGLCDADQKYIHAWSASQGFMNERVFRIACDDKQLEKSKEEIKKDVTYSGGDTMQGLLVNVINREKIAFDFVFKNMNEDPVDGIRMEYRIYYEQSLMTESNESPETKQKTFKDTITLPAVPRNGEVKVMTKPVEIHEDDINPMPYRGGDPRRGGKGKVHGIRARLYMKLITGEEVMREFNHPKSLTEDKFPWQ
jgi:hypothetical protein